MPNGECKKEVRNRMYMLLMKILNQNNGKRIAIISHSTAIRFLLMKWCSYEKDGLYYNNEKVVDADKCNFCETYKLEFDNDNNLVSIVNL